MPDTSKAAADAMAYALKVPCVEGLIRNRYSGRTFIEGGGNRRRKAETKYTPLREVLEGKRVLLVEDSIVRATTLQVLLQRIRQYGQPREIHVRVACPPIIGPCFYGIDMSTVSELFAAKFVQGGEPLTPEIEARMAAQLGADSLRYLPVDAIARAIGFAARRPLSRLHHRPISHPLRPAAGPDRPGKLPQQHQRRKDVRGSEERVKCATSVSATHKRGMAFSPPRRVNAANSGLQGIVAQIHFSADRFIVWTPLWLAGNRRSDTLRRSPPPTPAAAVACRESSLRYTTLDDTSRDGKAVACRESSLRYTATGQVRSCWRLWLAGNRRSDTLRYVVYL